MLLNIVRPHKRRLVQLWLINKFTNTNISMDLWHFIMGGTPNLPFPLLNGGFANIAYYN
jgi:hypothetical protein